jgi:hypothetical protein
MITALETGIAAALSEHEAMRRGSYLLWLSRKAEGIVAERAAG